MISRIKKNFKLQLLAQKKKNRERERERGKKECLPVETCIASHLSAHFRSQEEKQRQSKVKYSKKRVK